MSNYPEHDKLTAAKDQTQTIGKFLEWCEEQGLELTRFGGDQRPAPRLQDLLAQWAGIDLERLYAEKDEMFAQLRRMNGVDD
jgi:hypothetical protein